VALSRQKQEFESPWATIKHSFDERVLFYIHFGHSYTGITYCQIVIWAFAQLCLNKSKKRVKTNQSDKKTDKKVKTT
jgi:hypothetical protein